MDSELIGDPPDRADRAGWLPAGLDRQKVARSRSSSGYRELANRVGRVVRLAGIIDGRTVGTCTLSVATETAALYFIATDPAYRRRGVAT
ncbi:GNAT family N-acetyltransferase, partial [Actinoplanes solisilvae]|uniref:GNAT family N-acetyltransferase n=1 Tax=Actinoplanes solisilvae TaxID=2486853 RepID=UPI00196B1562